VKPRLVKSQREMEGRFEDVWVLVDEEDEVETWPDEAELQVVGLPAPRQDGAVRAAGAARSGSAKPSRTADSSADPPAAGVSGSASGGRRSPVTCAPRPA